MSELEYVHMKLVVYDNDGNMVPKMLEVEIMEGEVKHVEDFYFSKSICVSNSSNLQNLKEILISEYHKMGYNGDGTYDKRVENIEISVETTVFVGCLKDENSLINYFIFSINKKQKKNQNLNFQTFLYKKYCHYYHSYNGGEEEEEKSQINEEKEIDISNFILDENQIEISNFEFLEPILYMVRDDEIL